MSTATADHPHIAKIEELHRKCAALEFEAATLSDGVLTDAQQADWNSHMREIKRLQSEPMPRRTQATSGGERGSNIGVVGAGLTTPGPRWRNAKTGEMVRTVGPRQLFAGDGGSSVSIGRFCQAAATGNWSLAEPEKRAMALAGNDTSGSHFLIPEELSTQVIDLARSSSVLFGWGAQSVEMKSDTLRIARVESDPTFEVKQENAAFTGSAPTFGHIELHSRLLGTTVTSSRELAEDAPNFGALIEGVLQRALGAELDRLALIGNGGSDGVQGIALRTGIGSTGSVGAIAWEDFHNAAVAIRALNHAPNGIVLHPTIQGDAQILTSGDGTNSAKLWLGPPPSLDGIAMRPTTGIGTDQAIVGDGSKVIVGFRTQARVEMSTAADDAFEKHQVKWKITLRFDLGLTHAAAFHLLDGITT